MTNKTISSGNPFFSFTLKMIYENCYKKQTNKRNSHHNTLLTKTLSDFADS